MITPSPAASVAIPKQPMPLDLARYLPDRETPWNFSQELFERLRKMEYTPSKPFKRCEVLSSDPEFRFLFRYFFDHKPPGLSIRRVTCIHNPSQTKSFEGSLTGMEKAAQQFRPAWDEEEPKALRAKTTQRWLDQTAQFSPFIVRVDEQRKERFVHIRLLPLWHGTKHVDSICEIGFTFFGKHHMLKPSPSAMPGSQKSTDIGYFGSGIYFTNSARYAAMYNSGTLLLSWVAMRRPYPVVSDKPLPHKCTDMDKLEGQGAYQNSNAHYIPVTPIDPNDPECMECHPCNETTTPFYDEYVVFQSTQALPRFCVELGVDFPATPSATPKTPLAAAIEAGDIEAVRQLSERIEWLYEKDENGNPPLIQAARLGHKAICEILLKAGASTEILGAYKRNILLSAARNNHIDIVRICLANYREMLNSRDEDGYSSLMIAAYFGHLEICNALVLAGVDVCATGPNNNNALHWAAEQGQTEIVKKLAIYKNLLEARDIDGLTPLLIALLGGHTATCEALLKAGADVTVKTKLGRTALHIAAKSGKQELVQMFVAYRNLLDAVDNDNRTPLMSAAMENREICEILLKAGANRVVTTKSGFTALHIAVINKKIDVVRSLALYKELLEMRDSFGRTPLSLAAEEDQTEVCTVLLQAGASPACDVLHAAAGAGHVKTLQLLVGYKDLLETRDVYNRTPLLCASFNGHSEACELLLDAGANPKAKDEFGFNAMHEACKKGMANLVRRLVVHRELLEDMISPLHGAAIYGHSEVCEILLKAGANVLAIDEQTGSNVLHAAVGSGKVEVVRLFLSHRQLIDARNKAGFTPLLYAAQSGHKEICDLLLKSGANPQAIIESSLNNALHLAALSGKSATVECFAKYRELREAKNKNHKTPLLEAASDGHREACEILLKAGDNPLTVDNLGHNCLHLAAGYGKKEVVELLSKDKKLLDTVNNEGSTALSLAAMAGHQEVCAVLLREGANPFLLNKFGKNSLHTAALKGKLEVVKLLAANKDLLESRGPKDETALILAGNRATCELLLQMGANPKALTVQGWSVLFQAALKGDKEIMQLFIMHKDLINLRDKEDGFTPLIIAAANGHQEACEALLAAGADPRITDVRLCNALHSAAAMGKTAVVQTLVRFKELIEARSDTGFTPLLMAVDHGQAQCCEALIKAGADATATVEGNNALHIAKGNLEVLRVFLGHKQLYEMTDKDGMTPLMQAAMQGHSEICEALVKAGANPLAVNSLTKQNVLHVAAARGHLAIVKVFLAYKQLFEMVDKDGWTSLMLAAFSGHSAVCEALLKAGANPRTKHASGQTALHLAARGGKAEVVKSLTVYKDLLLLRDNSGQTAFDMAKAGGHAAVCAILQSGGSISQGPMG